MPRLKKGVLPTQFPNCPSYLSKKVKKRKSPKKRRLESLENNTKQKMSKLSSPINEMITVDPDSPLPSQRRNNNTGVFDENLESPEEDIPVKDSSFNMTENDRVQFFDNLFDNKQAFKIPIAWTRSDINDGV